MTSAIYEDGQDLIELLDQFNRKERYFLICDALGLGKFSLSEDFSRRLGVALGITIPTDARVWMDYHMDWLAAAVVKWHEPSESDVYPNAGLVRGSQQDVDLLFAFKEGGHYHLVGVEAKGYESWDNRQMLKKAKRLEGLFGKYGDKRPGLKVQYCLVSPRPPEKLDYTEWPDWMKPDGAPVWLELHVLYPRLEVNRWDVAQRKKSCSGRYFHITQG